MKEGAAVLKIAVCDDEQLYLDKTRAMLEQYAAAHGLEITAEAFSNSSALLDSIEAGNRASHQALLALLDHGIDGNNIKQMQDAKKTLQQHLIDR